MDRGVGPTLDLGDSLSLRTSTRPTLPGRICRWEDKDTTSAKLKLRIRTSLNLNTSMTPISCTPKPTSRALSMESSVPAGLDPFRPRPSRWTQVPPRSPPRVTTPRTCSLGIPTIPAYPLVKPTPTRASAPTRQTFPPARWDIDNGPSLPLYPCNWVSTTPSVPMPSVGGIVNPPNNTFLPNRPGCGWRPGPLWDLGT